MHAASHRTYERVLDLFTASVAEAQEAGEVLDGIDPRQIANALLTAMRGLEFVRKSGGGEAFGTAKASVVEGDACVSRAVQRREGVRAGEPHGAHAAERVREHGEDGKDRQARCASSPSGRVGGPGKRCLEPGELTDGSVGGPVAVGVVVVPEVPGPLVGQRRGAPRESGRAPHGEAEHVLFEIEFGVDLFGPGVLVEHSVKPDDEGGVQTGTAHGPCSRIEQASGAGGRGDTVRPRRNGRRFPLPVRSVLRARGVKQSPCARIGHQGLQRVVVGGSGHRAGRSSCPPGFALRPTGTFGGLTWQAADSTERASDAGRRPFPRQSRWWRQTSRAVRRVLFPGGLAACPGRRPSI
ncbi:conserved hypothetical protein [Streptomyces sp. SPB074]|nr:conserved hypothetical protein [Streptomyces sp. SPB074]